MERLIQLLLKTGAYRATKYLKHNLVQRATRTRYGKGRKFSRNAVEVSFTEGRPNYRERKFIKLCKKANEKFPVKKVQLQITK